MNAKYYHTHGRRAREAHRLHNGFPSYDTEDDEFSRSSAIYDDMIAGFEALHEDHQNRKRGLDILCELKRKRVHIQHVPGTMDSLKNRNTFPLIVEEVESAPLKSTRCKDILSNLEETSKKKQFLKALNTFHTNPAHDPHDPENRPYCVWDLPVTVDGDLVKLISIPEQYQNGHVYQTYKDGNLEITSTITPPGTISEPHIDQSGSGSLLTELLEGKLFVIWPPTPKNLSWFSNKYGLYSGTIFEAALEALERPHCIYLEQGASYILRPGHIHGVLTATTAAIAGVPVVHRDLRSDADTGIEWETKLIEQRSIGLPDERKTVKGMESGLRGDRKLWARHDEIEGNSTMDE